MVDATVLRSHAGGYLVYDSDQDAVFQCAARGRLKKERISIVTGDRVELDELDPEKGTAVICARLERHSMLSRPPLANVDQVVIVQAIHQPEWNSLLCDRYLVHFQLEIASATPVLCFNKCDLASESEILSLRSIYEPLGYLVIMVSATAGVGLAELAAVLRGKVSVLTGQSGVGKSSLLNYLEPSLHLRVGVMENESGVGRHTTTYSELYSLHIAGPDGTRIPGWVADTPGFNILELNHPQPHDVVFQFPEILALAHDCKFTNCLHLVESDCNVIANLESIPERRYQSYCAIVIEAQEVQKSRKDVSQKVESTVKRVGGDGKGKQVPILNSKYRAESRRLTRQQLRTADLPDDDSDLDSAESAEEFTEAGDDLGDD